MKLHDLSPDEGARPEGERKGRGRGANHGQKCGRGTKGQKKRNQIPVYFEGGQTPLYRRLPKFGFNPINRTSNEEVNVGQLNYFDDGDTVTPEDLLEAGIADSTESVKLLGDGELEVSDLTVNVHDVSEGARDKVQSADGTVDILSDSGD